MSVVRGFGLNGKSIYANVCKPQLVECQFSVLATNSLGISSLKSNGYIENVFMHTSTTPGTGNGGFVNPNPAAGYAVIQFKNNFNYYLGFDWSIGSPLTGSALTSVTAASVYVITSVGTTTNAQWQAVGYPLGFTPAVGGVFVATATQAIGGTGAVKLSAVSGISAIEVLGTPASLINNSIVSSYAGAQLVVQFLGATSSSVTTLVATAPVDTSVVNMGFWFDGSSVTVDGI